MKPFLQRIQFGPPTIQATILAVGANFAWVAALLASCIVFATWLANLPEESPLFPLFCGVLFPAPVVCAPVLFLWIPCAVAHYSWPGFPYAFQSSLPIVVPVFVVI